VDTTRSLAVLRQAANALGLSDHAGPISEALGAWTKQLNISQSDQLGSEHVAARVV